MMPGGLHTLVALIHSFLCSIGVIKRKKTEIPDLTQYDEEMDQLEDLVASRSSEGDESDA